MKRWCLMTLLLSYSATVCAFPDAENLQRIFENDPALRVAKAQWEAKQIEADSTEASPYEWNVELTGQQRRYQETNASSNEWNLALQHGVRWPKKTALDKTISNSSREVAALEFSIAKEDTIRDYVSLWLSWAEAKNREQLVTQQLGLTQENLNIVNKRLQANDASLQEVNLATAELASLQSQLAAAELASLQTKSAWLSRFPQAMAQDATLPTPKPPTGDSLTWKQRILNASPRVALIRLGTRQAHTEAQRAEAERRPDPTLGVFVASEAQSTEKIVGVSVSMPLAGAKRSREAKRADAIASAMEQTAQLEMNRAEANAELSYVSVTQSVAVWKAAELSAQAQQEAASRSKKGFALGETDLQTMLLAQRQVLSLADQALAARVAALKARYNQDIDAHQGWYPNEMK